MHYILRSTKLLLMKFNLAALAIFTFC